MSTASERRVQKNQIKVKVVHNAVSEITTPTRMGEFSPKIYQTFVSIRNDRQIMEHKHPKLNSHLAKFLLDKVKALESDVFAVLKRREMEKAQYKQFREVTFREIQLFEKTKNTEIALLEAKLTKQKLTIIGQKKLIKKLSLERNCYKKNIGLISKIHKSKKKILKSSEKVLKSISQESEDQLFSEIPVKYVDPTSEIESGESKIPTTENESESGEFHSAIESGSQEKRITETEAGKNDFLSEEKETASSAEVDSEESCEVEEKRDNVEEVEVEVEVVHVEQTREIEILSEEKNLVGKLKTDNLWRRKAAGAGSRRKVCEARLKSQVVVFVGKWLKKNVGSFDYSEANIMVVQGKTRQFCNEIKRRYLSSNTSLDGIQLSSDEKAAITKDLEKSYSS